MIECNFIFTLYKDPSLFDDYKNLKIDSEDGDIRTVDGMFYFALGQQLDKLGYNNFDNTSNYTYL
jgi:hypothetical protein